MFSVFMLWMGAVFKQLTSGHVRFRLAMPRRLFVVLRGGGVDDGNGGGSEGARDRGGGGGGTCACGHGGEGKICGWGSV